MVQLEKIKMNPQHTQEIDTPYFTYMFIIFI